jgi:hypothetical protein
MRKALLFARGLAVFALIPHHANAEVKLTKQQVQTVCNGRTSCVKDCGLNGEHICGFKCKGSKCGGTCMTCGAKARVLFPKHYANHVVRQAVRGSP